MDIHSKQTNKKKYFIIGAVIVLLIVVGVFLFLYLFPHSPTPAASTDSKTTTDQQKAAADTKKAAASDKASGSDPSPAPTPGTNGSKPTVGVAITAANQNGSIFQVRTLIQTIDSSGVCTLTLTRTGATTYTQTQGVQALPSTSTCKGFDIPTAGLAGSWTLTVTFENATLTGTVSQPITIK